MASGAGDRQMTKILPDIVDVMREGAANPKYTRLMRQVALGSTIHLVSNCEDKTDWDVEDAAQFNLDNETTIKRQGSNALETLDVGTTKGTFITMDEGHRPDNENWEEFGWLCMWVEDGSAVRLAGELTFQIKNAGTWSAEVSVPVNSNADKYEYKCIDITGLDRGLVQGFRFVNQRGSGGSEKVYIDDIIVTDMITGIGDATQAYTGPVWGGGCMIMTVATGQTLNPGEFVNFELGEAHAGVQNDQAVVGAVCKTVDFNKSSWAGSDTLPKQVIVAKVGSVIIARNDATGSATSDAVMIASGNASMDEAEANYAKYVAVALETAEANADTYFQLINAPVVA